jgi:hypothetical protein
LKKKRKSKKEKSQAQDGHYQDDAIFAAFVVKLYMLLGAVIAYIK